MARHPSSGPWRGPLVLFMALGAWLVAPLAATACPSCPNAVAARRSVVADTPLSWTATGAAPFAIMFLLAALTHRIGRGGRGGSG
jgi:hypothetical protein